MDAADDPGLRLEQQVCFPLYAASNLLTRLYRPLLEPLGLTYPQYLVMLALWERAPASVGEIGTLLRLDSGTLTPLLKRLEAAGIVVRERAADDERRVLVSLTPAGRALKRKAAVVPRTLACQVGLPPEQLRQLRSDLQALLRALESLA